MSLFNLYVTSTPQETKQSHSKCYGVKVGDIGIDFQSIKDRSKFLNLLARANSIKINDRQGIVIEEKRVDFGIYIRNADEKGVRCYKCETVFTNGECRKQEYEYPYSYGTDGISTENNFICDNCLEKLTAQVVEIKKRNAEEKKSLDLE